ncbi:hypothetical protein BDW22DRAFT_1307512, partial [Trametopsis cervina]
LEELLKGVICRYYLLNVDLASQLIADNCCHIRGAVEHLILDTYIGLDVWHGLRR